MRSVCILIPAYDPAEYAEEENEEEEEEVRGWGPGPVAGSSNRRTIVTHSHGAQDGGAGEASGFIVVTFLMYTPQTHTHTRTREHARGRTRLYTHKNTRMHTPHTYTHIEHTHT